jgi:hypothetical protein
MRNTSDAVVAQIRNVGAEATRDIVLDMRKVHANVRSALRHKEPTRRQRSLLFSLLALQSAATSEIARSLVGASWPSMDAALVSWSRATLYSGALSTVVQSPIEDVYATAIAHLLTSPSEARRSARMMRSHWLGAAEQPCADVLVFLPGDLYPTDCRAAASSEVLALLAAIESRSEGAIGNAVRRVARAHSRGGEHGLAPPISWVPMPLLLAREYARSAGLPWVDPPGPLWNLWRAFSPHRRRRTLQPIESQIALLVDSLRHHTESIRTEVREQIVLGEVFGAGQHKGDSL